MKLELEKYYRKQVIISVTIQLKNRTSRNSSKESLFALYDRLTEEELAEKLVDAERARCIQQHSLGWSLVNEVTGRKSSATGKLRGNTEKKWR